MAMATTTTMATRCAAEDKEVDNDVAAYAIIDGSVHNGSSTLYLPYCHPAEHASPTTDADVVPMWYDHYAHLFPSPRYIRQQQLQKQRLALQQKMQEEKSLYGEKKWRTVLDIKS